MKISILSVQITTVPTAKSSYQKAEVAYKNLTFQGKVEGKIVMSFGSTKPAFDVLATAQSGEIYDVIIEKSIPDASGKSYNNWVGMTKGDATNVQDTPNKPTTGYVATGNTPAARTSTYETPEERAKKQVYIVRQSSVSSALAALACGAKSPPKVGEVIEYAKHLEAYVFDLNVGFPDVPDFPAEAE